MELEAMIMELLIGFIVVLSSILALLNVQGRRERVGRSLRPGTVVRLRIRPPIILVGRHTTMVEGYENGVVCLSGFHRSASVIQLWNPSRAQLRHLPPPPAAAADSFRRNTGFRLGVGRHPSTGDLKVVRVCSPTTHHPSDGCLFNLFVAGTEVAVYSLRTNSWRTIDWAPLVDPAYPDCTMQFTSCLLKPSVVVNSCLHWSGNYNLSRPGHIKGISKFGIFAFDLATEAFRVMHPPRAVTQVLMKDGLAKLSGQLALVVRDPIRIEVCVDIWVMKEYNDPTSWTKQFSFNIASLNLPVLICPWDVSKIELTNNGHALISTWKGVIDYALNTQTVIHFGEEALAEGFVGFPNQDIAPSDSTCLYTLT